MQNKWIRVRKSRVDMAKLADSPLCKYFGYSSERVTNALKKKVGKISPARQEARELLMKCKSITHILILLSRLNRDKLEDGIEDDYLERAAYFYRKASR